MTGGLSYMLIAASLASTSLATQSSSNDVLRTSPDSESRRVAKEFSDCVVERRHRQVATTILNLVPNRVVVDDFEHLLDSDCLVKASKKERGTQLRFPGDHLRYAFAEALVRKEFSDGPPMDVAQKAPLAHDEFRPEEFQPPAGKKWRAKKLKGAEQAALYKQAAVFLSKFGECVVRAEPAKSRALVLTEPASQVERQAISEIQSALSSCLPAGQSFRANYAMMRGTIALNYYRLAHAPRLAVTPAGGSE